VDNDNAEWILELYRRKEPTSTSQTAAIQVSRRIGSLYPPAVLVLRSSEHWPGMWAVHAMSRYLQVFVCYKYKFLAAKKLAVSFFGKLSLILSPTVTKSYCDSSDV